jgi:hypothetical protein
MTTTRDVRFRDLVGVYRDPEHVMTLLGPVAITYSIAAPSVALMKTWSDAMDQWAPPIAMLVVIDVRARIPDRDTKRAIQEMVTRHQSRIAAFAYVVEGQGLGAGALRSALSLIGLVARYPFPQRVTATTEDATPWLLRHLALDLRAPQDEALVIQAVESMRALLLKPSVSERPIARQG